MRTITSVMRVYAPGIAQIFDRIFPDFYTEKENETIKKLFPTCESISIDYAVMEKAQEIMYFPLLLAGSDLGTWGALRGLLPQDKSGNATVGTDIRLYESKNFMDVYSLDEKSVIEDCYHAAYVGDVLKDEAYMQKLLKVYESGSIKIESELDYIYKEIVEYFLYNHVPSRYTETILEQLSNLVQEKELVIDYEHLNKN